MFDAFWPGVTLAAIAIVMTIALVAILFPLAAWAADRWSPVVPFVVMLVVAFPAAIGVVAATMAIGSWWGLL